MTADLAVYSPGVLAEKVEYCKLLADSGLLPDAYRAKPANVLYAVEYGESIGIPAMAAINGIHIIKGKPSASAGLIGALVRKAGHKLRVRGNDTTARAVIVRSDDPEFEFVAEWTLDRAVTAGLCTLRDGKPYARDKNGDPTSWEKYPAAMLKHRAVTEVARDACEEVLFGLHYTPEELGAQVDEDGVPVVVTVSQASTPAPAEQTAPQPEQQRQVDDAEVVAEPAQPKMISDGQCKAVHTLLSVKRGKLTDEAKHAGLSKFTGREITSTKQLTADEASRLLDALAKLPDHQPEQPKQALKQAADGNENFKQAEALLKLQQDRPQHDLEDDLRDAIESSADPADVETVMLTAAAARDDGRLTFEQYGRLAGLADRVFGGARQTAGAAA